MSKSVVQPIDFLVARAIAYIGFGLALAGLSSGFSMMIPPEGRAMILLGGGAIIIAGVTLFIVGAGEAIRRSGIRRRLFKSGEVKSSE